MNLIAWLLFGSIVGLVGYGIDNRGGEKTLISNILLGMGGALLGGILANTIFGFTLEQFDLSSFMLAITGSLLLLLSGRIVQKA